MLTLCIRGIGPGEPIQVEGGLNIQWTRLWRTYYQFIRANRTHKSSKPKTSVVCGGVARLHVHKMYQIGLIKLGYIASVSLSRNSERRHNICQQFIGLLLYDISNGGRVPESAGTCWELMLLCDVFATLRLLSFRQQSGLGYCDRRV